MKGAHSEDVAREAGVARSTAALALRDSPRLRPETRLAVRHAAERLGYVYNRRPRDCAPAGPTSSVCWSAKFTNPFYAEIVAGVGAALESAGYVALLANMEESPAREFRSIVSRIPIPPRGGRYWRLPWLCVPPAALIPGFSNRALT